MSLTDFILVAGTGGFFALSGALVWSAWFVLRKRKR